MTDARYAMFIDKAYKNYWSNAKHNNLDCLVKQEEGSFLVEMRFYNKEEFINKCKLDNEFSEKWGLKIEERELSLEERVEHYCSQNWVLKHLKDSLRKQTPEQQTSVLSVANSPTKLITVIYNNKKIESYI